MISVMTDMSHGIYTIKLYWIKLAIMAKIKQKYFIKPNYIDDKIV